MAPNSCLATVVDKEAINYIPNDPILWIYLSRYVAENMRVWKVS